MLQNFEWKFNLDEDKSRAGYVLLEEWGSISFSTPSKVGDGHPFASPHQPPIKSWIE
jgi:hypothetical protein